MISGAEVREVSSFRCFRTTHCFSFNWKLLNYINVSLNEKTIPIYIGVPQMSIIIFSGPTPSFTTESPKSVSCKGAQFCLIFSRMHREEVQNSHVQAFFQFSLCFSFSKLTLMNKLSVQSPGFLLNKIFSNFMSR